jgi:tricorn protease
MKNRPYLILFFLCFTLIVVHAEEGYYRFPTVHEQTVIFTAEGDLWKVSTAGGDAQRLTSHHGLEIHADISPDGKYIAFNGQYEGPAEIYLIPIAGGIPKRLTFEGMSAGRYSPVVYGWTKEGEIIYSTYKYSTLPNAQLVVMNPETLEEKLIPLHQANEGVFDGAGNTVFFTRLPFQGSHTRRYKGGTAENIWKYTKDTDEAIALTADYAGISRQPMWYENRVYFCTDMDGTMNVWSMNEDGQDRKQHTFSGGWDIQTPDIYQNEIVYQKGADLFLYSIDKNVEKKITINLISDFDQRRVRWVENPGNSITSTDLSPDGKHIAITARGRLFVAPAEGGRWREITRLSGVRYQNAEFIDDENIAFLSDETSEMEVWETTADGMTSLKQISSGNDITILNSTLSPDGKWMIYTDKNEALVLVNLAGKTKKIVNESLYNGFAGAGFSPDSKWISYSMPDSNLAYRIHLYEISSAKDHIVTTDRADSYGASWSPDGEWLYFLSDREFQPLVYSPWGPRQPEPFYDKTTKLYALALCKDERFPFLPSDELIPKEEDEKDASKEDSDSKKSKKKKGATDEDEEAIKKPIDIPGLPERLYEVPVGSRNFSGLELSEDYIYWTERDLGESSRKLYALKISNEGKNEPTLVEEDIRSFQLSDDQKKMLIRKNSDLYVVNANGSKADLSKAKVEMKDWAFRIDPVEDWKQMLVDAWRLERDYFWDPGLHGVDWDGMLKKHQPLVDRVTDRYELDDLIAHMVAELSTLHTFVYGGDKRDSPTKISVASLGAKLSKNLAQGGYMIEYIYQSDPDYLDLRSPLDQPQLEVEAGDVITSINGVKVMDVDHIAQLLQHKAGQQVRLNLKHADGSSFEQIITPITSGQELDLRYTDWEVTRRQITEEQSADDIGYIHLRAMGGGNYVEFLKGYYPVFNRKGLILDVRHNRGGNIDSWILEKLMRKIWFYWQPRKGQPYWNMQYAFNGHMVILCNERTASDGEAVTEGFRRLGLGKVIGTRTWGGEVWLSSGNRLVDGGIATAAEYGVYDKNGEWLIEGHGVDPDIVVDNLPHETFKGKDAQLEAAIEHLKKLIEEDPRDVPRPPPYPNKAFDYKE